MTNQTLDQISISAEHTGAPTQSSGTIAGIILGCVALLALISALTALCYWWKSSGSVGLPAFPAKCYTISSGKHTPGTCVPGQERGTGAEDSTFMLNYMTHNYMDPMQENFDVDMDNDSFLSSLESSIHFSNAAERTTTSAYTQNCSVTSPHPAEAYFRQQSSPGALMTPGLTYSESTFDPVHRFHARRDGVETETSTAYGLRGAASTSSQRRVRGIQAGVAVLPRRLNEGLTSGHPTPLRRPRVSERRRHDPNVYALDRGQSLITTYDDDRGRTETLAAKTVGVFQYPPPMAPISLLMRK